jgi:hypothetical protein
LVTGKRTDADEVQPSWWQIWRKWFK